MKRTAAVAAAAALAAALAATLAAFGGRPVGPSPDPQQARDDGCGRDSFAEARRELPTWVYVNDRAYPADGPAPPPQRLAGRVTSRYSPDLAVHPSEEDLPPVHRAYDFNFDVLPDRAYSGLLGGSRALQTGNFAGHGPSTGRVHVEREQTALPRFVRPERADRVTLVGSWVWDCGHWTPAGERTELHSYRAVWLARNPGGPSPLSPYGESEGDLYFSNDKTYAGVEAECAHRTKGNRVAFRLCLATEGEWLDPAGTYRFSLRVPPPPSPSSRLVVRVLDAGSSRGAPRPRVTVRGHRVEVALVIRSHRASKLVVAARVLARWAGAPVPEHLRLRFTRLLVRRAMDPGCPGGQPTCGSNETTHGEQVSASPGEWNVYLDAAGAWAVWGKGLLRARDGQVFLHGPVLDVYVLPTAAWRLFVFTRECDFGSLGTADGPTHAMSPCPRSSEFGQIEGGDDVPGMIVNRFASAAASLGVHRGRPSRHDTTCPPVNSRGCYELNYVVTRIRDDRTRLRRVVVSANDERRNRWRKDDRTS